MSNLKLSPKRTDQPSQTTDHDTDHILYETRHFNAQGEFTHRSLNINSPHVKDTLRRIIGEYPGATFRTENVRLQAPYRCLFHYLEELRRELEEQRGRRKVEGEMRVMNREVGREVGGMSDDEERGESKGDDRLALEKKTRELVNESIEHLEFLVEFIEEEFKEARFEAENYLPEGLISYEKYDIPLPSIHPPHTFHIANANFGKQLMDNLKTRSNHPPKFLRSSTRLITRARRLPSSPTLRTSRSHAGIRRLQRQGIWRSE